MISPAEHSLNRGHQSIRALVPVIVLTSLSQRNEEQLLSEGAAAYFEKSTLGLDHPLLVGRSIAHNLGLKVVAEGAETAEQVRLLKELKCELVQGYFFARPGDHAAAQALLMSNYSAGLLPPPTAVTDE